MTSLNTMVRETSGMNYSQCSSDELMSFIRRRGLTEHLKGYLAQCLNDADRDARFSFLDLSPEIRNMIYGEVFSASEARKGVRRFTDKHFSLLRTCKQIRAEATEISKSMASFPICIVVGSGVHDIKTYENGRDADMSTIPVSRQSLQSTSITNLSSLAIDICVASPAPETDLLLRNRLLNIDLNQIHEFVLQYTKIRHLYVSITAPHELCLDQRRIADVLSPVAAICAQMETASFSFTNAQQTLQTSLRETASAFMYLRSMKPEFEKVMNVRKMLYIHGFWSMEDTKARYEKVFKSKALEDVSPAIYCFADAQELNEAISELQTVFNNTWKHYTSGRLKAEWEKKKKLLADGKSQAVSK